MFFSAPRLRRFRLWIHYLITLGMILQMLPAPVVWATGDPDPQPAPLVQPLTELSGSPIAADALGENLLPPWMAPLDSSAPDPEPFPFTPTGLLAPQADAQCPQEYNLDMTLTPPPYRISMGNVAGDTYTVTLTNHDTISATEISLAIDLPAGFYYIGGSATATSNISGTLTIADQLGRTVMVRELQPGRQVLDLDLAARGMNSGVYLVTLTTDSQRLVRRLAVSR